MIFVTVGTHEQSFNRLVAYIDQLKKKDILDDEVIIQIGFSTYEPQYCKWERLYPYQQMIEFVAQAKIVITHGGPSSFIMPLQIGKIPIVVPRQKKYDEHVNDHQLDFSKTVAKRQGNIIVVEDIEKLGNVICGYDQIIESMPSNMKSNNIIFNEKLEKIIDRLFL